VEIITKDFKELTSPFENPGIIITNPPYGERLKPNSISELYTSFGDMLKQKFTGYTAWLISSSDEGLKSIGLKPTKKIDLYNGALACSYRSFELFKGSRKPKVFD
jgi:Predicted N6-adenine-specific DNA methylase